MQNKTCGCSPRLGLDGVPSTAKGLQLNFHRVGWEAGWAEPISLCVSLESHRTALSPPALIPMQDPILCCHSTPPLHCFHQAETLPCGVYALVTCASAWQEGCHCCPWWQLKHIQCHCKFYGTIFIGGFGQNAVVVQLVTTNCWLGHVCAQNDLVVI